ncbi:MAG: DsbA family protein [Gemmatimonadetes bacterium]|nr:DsbA family protein [Gemmatimonadota bacterium]
MKTRRRDRATLLTAASGIIVGIVGLGLATTAEVRAQYTVDLDALGHDRGQPSAPVEIIEFADFGCPACAEFARETWPDFRREFVETGIVAWKFIPFVFGTFRNSRQAANAAECVADLAPDAFWSMHDVLYEQQRNWGRRRRPNGEFVKFAVELGIDEEAFKDCLDEEPGKERIRQNTDTARDLGVRATPTFFVNGTLVQGALPLPEWRKLIEQVRAGEG